MVLLIDTNVIIDYLSEREGFFEPADKIMKFCSRDDVQGYVAFHSLANLWYILRHKLDSERRKLLMTICSLLQITGASHSEVVAAIKNEAFKDFEDALQDKCAAAVHADFLVTRNVKDFAFAETKVITPADFCQKFIS